MSDIFYTTFKQGNTESMASMSAFMKSKYVHWRILELLYRYCPQLFPVHGIFFLSEYELKS